MAAKYKILIILFFILSCQSEIHKEYYEDGTLKEQYTIRNEKYNGVYKSLYKNGVPAATGKFSRGQMVGEWHYYYPNGEIQSIQEYSNGILVNINVWDKNNERIVIDGSGIAVLYYPNGDTMSMMHYEQNKLHGKFKTWFKNGQVESIQFYEHGEPVGEWLFWNEQGELVNRKNYNEP